MSRVTHPLLDSLKDALQKACQPTYVPYILEGRKRVLAMPLPWVISNIEAVARESLNLSDYWEYERLLEVLNELSATDLLKESVLAGLSSNDADVRDIAEIWRDKVTMP
jgi:hypothetical protein